MYYLIKDNAYIAVSFSPKNIENYISITKQEYENFLTQNEEEGCITCSI